MTTSLPGPLPGLGLGFLCYKSYDTFSRALSTYKDRYLFDHFVEQVVFFNSIDAEACRLADQYALRAEGTDQNLGILGGFKALAQTMQSEFVLLLENDLPLIEDAETTRRRLEEGLSALQSGSADVFRFRHVAHPGQRFQAAGKYLRYHGPGALPALRRLVRPQKAHKLLGNAIYCEASPARKFGEITEAEDSTYRIPAAHITWTNQSIMVRRDFFLNEIIAWAEANPSSRTVNGFPDIEKEWNCARWRKSGWVVGAGGGLFTHERI
ncbi:MAG: hypothetical protein AAGF20_03700 [Pseudomonadota bacterium]